MAGLRTRGRLHDQARQFDADLTSRQVAAQDQMLAAWTDSYAQVRTELDRFYAKVEASRALGLPTSPAWAYQERRLKNLLDTVAAEVGRYAGGASLPIRQAQASAIQAAARHARTLTATAAEEALGIVGQLADTDPRALVQQAVGFLGDGSALSTHLAKTLAPEVVDQVRSTVLRGLATGKGQDWFVREVTRNYALAQSRAVTIMRTETLRVYRETSRATYEANADVLEGWTWQAHLDARTCIACAVMDGTLHPVTDTLDGHPRCRCAMIPRTKSWEDLGVPGLDDTRPPVPSGKDWVEGQTPAVQKAMMGPAKFEAWKRGDITLDDMVAQHHSDDFGSMRTERSLKAITEGRNTNGPVRYLEGKPQVLPDAPPASTNPFTGQELSDALSPTRKRTQAAIRKELEQTPHGKDLAAQIKAFTETRGGVANLRKNLVATIDGTASPGVRSKAQAFMDAIDAYPVDEVPALFRGIAVKVEENTNAWWDAFEGQFAPGSRIDLNASSFTSSERKAAEFSSSIGGTRRASSNYTAVRFYLEEGSHALPVESLSKFKAEKEWITGGQFEVVEFIPARPGGSPFAKVVIRQVKGLGK